MEFLYTAVKWRSGQPFQISSTERCLNTNIFMAVDFNSWFSLSRRKKKKKIKNYRVKKLKNIIGCRKLPDIPFFQVLGLYGIPYSSYPPKCLQRHSMETPCWCPCRWAPTWRPEINENIWNSLLL